MWSLRNSPIQRKLTIVFVLITATALVLACFALYTYERLVFSETLNRNLATLAKITDDNCETAITLDNPEEEKEILGALRAEPQIVAACIYTATVYGIVQSHRGWIEVSSTLGHGTTFKVFFPVAEVSTTDQTESFMPEQDCRGNETILIVEDIAELREMVRQILESYGYSVIEAPNGVAALSVWKEHKEHIDLLLTDIVMPQGMSGQDLAQKLLAEKKSLKVIFTSGHSIDLISRDIKLCEGINFIQKPYQALTLAQIIRTCLDRRETAVC